MPETEGTYRILGVDPGLGVTGYAVLAVEDPFSEPILVDGGVLRSNERAPLEERLGELHHDLSRVISDLSPAVMSVEDLYAHYNHPRTSIIMGHARGVIFLAAAQVGISVHSYGATEIKKSLVGVGRASKAQVQRMVQQRLGLDELPEPNDFADAVAAAYCYIDRTLRRTSTAQGVKQ
ncbi:MAG: crossover junction endodeoxyribonuclease RuvC [Nitrospinaceae bacterium]|nr:crossover junction endodeoxyribonuclease RuvC [Nitrospinaceae bacterium]MBT3435454.1 crossover junction endodeoxyribonuclease RuvC [Nitrospinaceae bacterium]MBT3821315.1 crossover junction endodeoxyribonuclease RuvC [Nitrospinaceae bacterium]MBT4094052.1 crossover junction endodeoxyribonuclease RuvC [Nitrospinaceae bacterium]MBT4431820.1 crossover junction endodeoxyribonuclease RuvC [Nitrospinaceae bacterium]